MKNVEREIFDNMFYEIEIKVIEYINEHLDVKAKNQIFDHTRLPNRIQIEDRVFGPISDSIKNLIK